LKIGVSLSPETAGFGPLLYAGNLHRGLTEVRGRGYTGVELSLRDPAVINVPELETLLSDHGLDVYTIATGQSYYTDGFSLYDEFAYNRNAAVDRTKGLIEIAARFNAKMIIGGLRGRIEAQGASFERNLEQGHEALRRVVEIASLHRVHVLLEPLNRYETNVVNTIEQGLELIAQINSPWLHLLPDTFHMNIEEASLAESLIKAGDQIGYIHLADSNRHAPGWGHIDFPAVLQALKQAGYDGPVGIEVLPLPGPDEAATQAIEYLTSINNKRGIS
jgi:sugar phosphate isomerase/epimerase